MHKRNFYFEIAQTVLSVAIIVLAALLLFLSETLPMLFPVLFGLAAVLCILYGLEGIAYNQNRVIKKRRLIFFIVLALIFLACAFFSIRAL